MLDTIIIGSGPAGVSAAIYLKRANINPLVLTTNNSTLKKVNEIENYYGFSSVSGPDLYNAGVKQLEYLNVDLKEEEVLEITKEEYFKVLTTKNEYQSKTVIIATGVSRNKLSIKGMSEFEGRGLSYCATCDGFFFRNKKIAVIGNGSYAVNEAKHLLNITDDITILTNGEEINPIFKSMGLKYIETKIKEIKGNNLVEHIVFDDEEEILIDGVFVALGVAGASTFSKTLGITLNQRFLAVDQKYETNIPGLFAIGDSIGGLLQVSKAVSDGAEVSMEIIKRIKGN